MNPDNLKGICGNCAARELCCGGCRVHAIAKYKDFLAPDPQCQIVYDMGLFPEYAMEDVEKICEYGGNDD
jgi:sulfatase maturation enzyme AslB (radical SAM superfamily)